MLLLLSILVGLAAALLALPLLSDALSFARSIGRPPSPRASGEAAPRLLFLVPAHDESGMIGRCVDSLLAQDYPRAAFDLVVIADNCTDETAAVAEARGARCLVRTEPDLPGKPRAIAHAVAVLSIADYDAVVIVDADAVVDPGFARGVARVPDLRSCGAQAYNDVSNPGTNGLTRLAVLFGAARYELAYPLKQRAGLNVPMQGNGMCIGTDILRALGWRAFSICEDWELYAQLTEAGYATRLARDARIYAHEASTLRESSSQRKRWSGGKMTVFLTYGARVLRSRRVGSHQKLDLLGELAAVGPAVHTGIVGLLAPLCLMLQPPGAAWLAGALALTLLRTAGYTLLALPRVAEPGRTLLSFAGFPAYVLWRLWIQLGALSMVGDRPWVRTGRPSDAAEALEGPAARGA